jgi:hypothetical protein
MFSRSIERFLLAVPLSIPFLTLAAGQFGQPSYDYTKGYVTCTGYVTSLMYGTTFAANRAYAKPGGVFSTTGAILHEGVVYGLLSDSLDSPRGCAMNTTYYDRNGFIRNFITDVGPSWRCLVDVPNDRSAPNIWALPNESSCSWPAAVYGDSGPLLPGVPSIWTDTTHTSVALRATIGSPDAGCGATVRVSAFPSLTIYINGLYVGKMNNSFSIYSISQSLRYGDVIAVKVPYSYSSAFRHGFAALINTDFGAWGTSNISLWRATIARGDWVAETNLSWTAVDLPDACGWIVPSIEKSATQVPDTFRFLKTTYLTHPSAKTGDIVLFRTAIGVGAGSSNCPKQTCSVSEVNCCY